MPFARRLLEVFVTGLFLVFEGVVFLEEKRSQWFRRKPAPNGPGTFVPMRPSPKPTRPPGRS